MHRNDLYLVYILSNMHRTVFYIRVTNNLGRRINEHIEAVKNQGKSFAARYQCMYLLYFEHFPDPVQAVAREKQIKGWVRNKKIQLIHSTNPEMKFLNDELF